MRAGSGIKQHGTPEPEYTVLGGDITVKFTEFKTSKIPKRQIGGLDGGLNDTLDSKMLIVLKTNSNLTQNEIARETDTALRTIQRKLKELPEKGVLERKGGKR